MPTPMRPLAVITGGTSGIGLAVAQALRGRFDLLLIYRDRHDAAAVAKRSLSTDSDSRIEVLAADLTRRESHLLIQKCIEEFERPPEILINAAGYTYPRLFLLATDHEIDEMISTHVMGMMKLTRLVAWDMCRAGRGKVINFSSVAVNLKRGFVVYATAKAAVEAFTTALASEIGERGVTVNAIRPALVSDDVELKGTVTLSAVLEAVEFLVSPDGEKTNGRVIDVTPSSCG